MRYHVARNIHIGADEGWIIVATRQDQGSVNLILTNAALEGVKIGRVIITDSGPVKIYRSYQ